METEPKTNDSQKPLTHRHETLFLWDVRKSNPNGDPNGNEPRIDRHTKRCDVTDVCIKRSVRNYIAHEKGVDSLLVTRLGEDVSKIVTLTERVDNLLFGDSAKKEEKKKLVEAAVGRRLKNEDAYKSFLETPSSETLGKLISDKKKEWDILQKIRAYICKVAIDLRMFGSVLAIQGKSPLAQIGGPFTGPIQVEIGTSLHKVVQSNKQITSVMAPDKASTPQKGEEVERGGGLFGDTHCIEYGLFATSAVANENAAKSTGLSDEDHQLFLKALWRGTRERHTRSKNGVPRLLIDIKYTKSFHFGDLINLVSLDPKTKNGKPLEEEQYRSIEDFDLNISKLIEKLKTHLLIIDNIKFASNGLMDITTFKENFSDNKVNEFTNIDYDNDNSKEK